MTSRGLTFFYIPDPAKRERKPYALRAFFNCRVPSLRSGCKYGQMRASVLNLRLLLADQPDPHNTGFVSNADHLGDVVEREVAIAFEEGDFLGSLLENVV